MSDEKMPANVIEAIAAVMRELPAIGKNQQVQGDGPKYKFRGVEDVTAVTQKLMGRYCVVFVPRLVACERREISVGSRGSVWDQYEMSFEFDIYGPGGVGDKIVAGPFLALGRDNSDKGTAKAGTMAYKAALVQVFCIGDSTNDADNERHENAERHEPEPPSPAKKARAEFGDRVRSSPVRDAFKAWAAEQGLPSVPAKFTDEQLEAASEWLVFAESAWEQDHQPADAPVEQRTLTDE